jgi:hypothetical protein
MEQNNQSNITLEIKSPTIEPNKSENITKKDSSKLIQVLKKIFSVVVYVYKKFKFLVTYEFKKIPNIFQVSINMIFVFLTALTLALLDKFLFSKYGYTTIVGNFKYL